MNIIIRISLLLLFILPAAAHAEAITPAAIRYLEGDVVFRTPDGDDWLPAAVNTPLDEGDEIWCPENGRIEVRLADGSLVRLDGGSLLQLVANEDRFTQLHLSKGRLYLKTPTAPGAASLQIDADDTTILPQPRTRLRIDMLPDGLEDVSLLKGSAYVEGNGSRTRVRAGEHIVVDEGHSEVLPLAPADSWELWNLDRDSTQARSTRSAGNLPEELRSTAAELDTGGTWVSSAEFGMVWRPVVLADDWAPYRNGRWIWKGDDYVWVSSEPWGWVPYHYGRWTVIAGFGWCWVPPRRGDVYWGPGYVGWYTTDSHIGWTPLAPGETYYGRRHLGRDSAIAASVTVRPATVTYRNRHTAGGLTVVARDDFRKGRISTHQPPRNTGASLTVSIGTPAVRPLPEARFPAVKQTPPRTAPPQIERHDRRELRDRYPRITPQPAPRHRQPEPVESRPTPPPQKRVVHPVVPASGQGAAPSGIRPPEPPARRGDDRITPPAAVTPPVQSDRPAAQRNEAPRQQAAPPQSPSRPAAVTPAPPQKNGDPARPPRPAASSPQPADRNQQQGAHPVKERIERKIWQVTTPEGQTDGENRGAGRKDRERGR